MAWQKARWLTPEEMYNRELAHQLKDVTDEETQQIIDAYNDWYSEEGNRIGERDTLSPSALIEATDYNRIIHNMISNIYNTNLTDDKYIIFSDKYGLKNAAKEYGWEFGKDNDEDPDSIRIPKSFIKDKDKLEYMNLYKQLVEHFDTSIAARKRNVIRDSHLMTNAHNYLTTKALKNILKSSNIKRAVDEIRTFVNDYGSFTDRKFDSLNQLRAYPNQLARATDLTERILGIDEDEFIDSNLENLIIKALDELGYDFEAHGIIPIDPDKQINLYDLLDKVQPGWEKLLPAELSDDPSDFGHVPIMDDLLKDNIAGWRVIRNKQDMLDTGAENALDHCYGNLAKYGPTHHKNYCNRMRRNNSILLTNGKVTAEIDVHIAPDGTVEDILVGQIQGKGNTDRDVQPGMRDQIATIAKQLIGKTFETSDKRCKFVRRMETHDFDQEPRLIAALNRRF